MSKKNKDIEVKVEEVKRNAGNSQVTVHQLSIGKNIIGVVIPTEDKRFQVEVGGKVEAVVKTLDEGFEFLIADYNLHQ
ncbi:MAG: DUF2969 domain-containing protein [Lactobacillales bacterium]|jgi:exosome complex RNA-binding protein Rrp4|nr:DUF2969 domain-containing protein [Lactobacillales bacterium]